MQHINLETFAKGAFSAQVNRELQKVAANIQDPNTDAKAKRKISVVIEFKPNEERDFGTVSVHASASLAPALGSVTAMCFGKDLKTGEVEAAEIGAQLPGQLERVEEKPDGTVRTVDPTTGEIYDFDAEQKPGEVIDLRRKQA